MIFKKHIILLLLTFFTSNILFAQVLEIPEPTNISVNKESGLVELSWTMKNAEKVDGYIIKRKIFGQTNVVDGSFNTVATIANNQQFTYTDSSNSYGYSMPNSRAETYRIVSYKNTFGGKVLYSNMSRSVSTMYLSPIDFDLCKKQNKLQWTACRNYKTGVKAYKIYYTHAKNEPEVFMTELSPSDTSFVHENIKAQQKYLYHIKAVSNSGIISFSNIQKINTQEVSSIKVLNANYASVIKKGHIEVSFTVDKNAKIKSYNLLKSNNKQGKFEQIAQFEAAKQEIITYVDTLKTNKNIVYYKLAAINECGDLTAESNIANNILLKARASETEQFINNLSWNKYEDWLSGVRTYIIYRKYNNNKFEKIAELPSNITSYTDNLKDFIHSNPHKISESGKFCYFIEAIENLNNPYGIMGQSKSNKSCTYQEAVVYLPNAINPNSHLLENRTFRPITTFVSNYKLTIYNRWGGIVFQSNDPMQAWDGKKNGGDLMPRGTYVFLLQYNSKNKQTIKRTGEINLIY